MVLFNYCLSVLLPLRDNMAKASYKKKYLIGSLLAVWED